MRGALILAGLIAAGSVRAAEAEIEPLDADFLEYLANMEGDDADWTLLAEAGAGRKSKAEADGEAPPEAKAKSRKPSQEATKPAGEER